MVVLLQRENGAAIVVCVVRLVLREGHFVEVYHGCIVAYLVTNLIEYFTTTTFLMMYHRFLGPHLITTYCLLLEREILNELLARLLAAITAYAFHAPVQSLSVARGAIDEADRRLVRADLSRGPIHADPPRRPIVVEVVGTGRDRG